MRRRHEGNCDRPRDPLYPVYEPGRIPTVQSADGWGSDDGDAKFVGCLIELDVA
jgi:hypothetical protein